MSTAFDPEASGPGYLYMKLADDLADQIEDGTLPRGAMLPNERRLATEYGVSIGTARRATRVLRERDVVVTLPGKGTYVVCRPGESDAGTAR